MKLLMLLSPETTGNPATFPAFTPTFPRDAEIVARQCVAFGAMGLAQIKRSDIVASHNIDSCGYRFQMGWIHTGFYPAQVIKLKTHLDRAPIYFINNAMRHVGRPVKMRANTSYPAVSPFAQRPSPKPTTIGLRHDARQYMLNRFCA